MRNKVLNRDKVFEINRVWDLNRNKFRNIVRYKLRKKI